MSNKNRNHKGYTYALINILSLSLFSNNCPTNELDMNKIEELLNKIEDLKRDASYLQKDFFENIKPVRVLRDSKDKVQLKNQSLLIINEVILGDALYRLGSDMSGKAALKEKILALILINSALEQIDYLINDFITEEEILCFNQDSNIFCFNDLGYFLFALAKVKDLSNNNELAEYFPIGEKYDEIYNKTLLWLFSKEDEILNIPTHYLSELISCLAQSLEGGENVYFVLSLGEELISRCIGEGYLLKNKGSEDIASLATHFKGLCALLDCYKFSGFYNLYEEGIKIYDNLEELWDDEIGLFVLRDLDYIKYTTKNLSFVVRVLANLHSLSRSKDKKAIENKLNKIISTAERIGLVNMPYGFPKSTPGIDDILDSCRNSCIYKGFKGYYSENNLMIDKDVSIEDSLYFAHSLLQASL